MLLFKAIIVFTSIYFESYCKIPARSNKSVLQSFYHKIHLHVKGILNQNKQIKTKCRSGFIQPARVDSGQCLKRNHHWNALTKNKQKKNLYIIFLVVVSLFTSTSYSLCHFLSLILGTALSPYPGDVIFEWPLTLFRNFRSELHTHILPIFWVQYGFFCCSYFLPQLVLTLKVTKWKVLL